MNKGATGKLRRKAIVNRQECVACGCCVLCCPKAAITVERGLYAVVDSLKCIGCGKCAKACPASVIAMEEVAI